MRYKIVATALCFVVLNLSILWANWIVKINDKTITTQEFQNYVDFRKYMAGSEKESIEQESDLGKALLAKYIETQLILIDAQKNGYSVKHEKVQERIQESKKEWLLLFFVNKQIDLPNIRATKEEVVEYFSNLQKGQPTQKKYSELSRAEQEQLYQETQISKYRNIRSKYQEELEERYKVRRYKLGQNVVAKVDSKPISQKDLETFITSRLGVSIDMFKQNAARFEELKSQAREELVFETLAAKEMERTNFKNKRIVKIAFKYFQDSIVAEIYLRETILRKIKVGGDELDVAYSNNWDMIRERKWNIDQAEKFLEERIRQKKFNSKLSDFVTTKKEEATILRNKKELEKIK